MELSELLDKKQLLSTVTVFDSEELLDWINDNIAELLDLAIAKKQNGKVKVKPDASALVPAYNRWMAAFKAARDAEPTKAMQYFYGGGTFAFNVCAITARELTFPSTPGDDVDVDKLDSVCEAFLTVARTIAGCKGTHVEPIDDIPEGVFSVMEGIQDVTKEQLKKIEG